ncbi:transposase [Streptomyces sp. NBC_00555]|uniref:transposase n=1 Tax=Streptomyces sp. NBC_00555 TaxID=2903662 RepID=UPI00224F6D73|nr:transposase [Streptomyces sp. NBC_00555]MCX5010965.1 transposase [Streptomyces sp. NBC_00555]
MRRRELSDAEWELVQPLLPRPVFGRPRLNDRTVLNGIVWKFRTGVAWRDVPGGNTNDCTQFTAVMDAIRVPRTGPGRPRMRRGSRGGRPPVFDKQVYKRRNVVERCFNRLKQWRGIATRYDKTAQSYQAAVTLASLLMWA